MVKTENSTVEYKGWLCGGSIVHPRYVLSSASCLLDVDKMYVVAGYKHYVKAENILNDECTKRYRKRVIKVCVPKLFNLLHENKVKWSTLDIGFAKVETSYDFNDFGYILYCSYKPKLAVINFEVDNEKLDTDCVIYGWGHILKYRTPEDIHDYNNNELLSTTVKISDKNECKLVYKEFPTVIDGIMICSNQRQGICQNDHGGPLVHKERNNTILGVQATFMVDDSNECRNPYLYTSTYLMKAFIYCVLYREIVSAKYCEAEAKKMGYIIEEKKISFG